MDNDTVSYHSDEQEHAILDDTYLSINATIDESFAINEDIFDCILNCSAEVERIMEKTSNGHGLLQLLCKQLKTCRHIWIRTRQERLAKLSFDDK